MTIPLVALAFALLLVGRVYGGDCSGTAPNDLCEAGRPALTSSGLTLSGQTAHGSSTPGRFRSSRSPKVHSAISAVASAIEVRRSTESAPAELKKLSTKLVRVNDAGEIHVYIVLTEWSPEHVAELEALGLRVEATVPTRRLIQGWVPSHALDDVAALDAVKEVKPPAYGMREGAGAVNTPGDAILGAAAARSAFGVSGAGVKVGVISDGVDHLANSVMSNDLPGGVQVLAPGRGDEGTAMLEIVHDLAPGAALAFYGPSTSVDMANGINALAAAGARVVVDDLSFFFEPKFEDGLIADTVRGFATGGRVYVSSAGNRAQQHYRAGYSPVTGQNFPSSEYPAVHNYGSGSTDIGNTLVVPPFCSLTVILQWNNPFGAASDDFDLFIARSSDFAILAASAEVQTGTQDPLEATVFTNTTASPVVVFIAVSEFHLVSPPASLILDYFAYLNCSSNPGLQYVTPSESVAGNHNLVEALPIAAVNAATPAQAEVYSSQGPGTISFPFPEVRAVPVLTSVDCVPTQAGVLGFFVLPFCGTSAAAPHVAGIAALLIERAPTLSTEQLRGVLTGTAVDLGPPGFDFTYGFGRVDAFAAVQAALTATVALGAAILPGSRAVQVGHTATAFATIVASGTGAATGCAITPTNAPAGTAFFYQQTNAANAPIGAPNSPATIPAGGLQTFIFGLTPNGPFPAADIHFSFDCTNTTPAPDTPGVNTFLLTSTSSPGPDIVALGATTTHDGIANIPGTTGTGFFSVATVNVGAGASITATVDTGSAFLPVALSLCQTNPANGQCINPTVPGSSATVQINANQTPTFAVFVRGTGNVPFLPGVNRAFVRFKTASGATVGATSVAVRTQ